MRNYGKATYGTPTKGVKKPKEKGVDKKVTSTGKGK